MLGKWSHGVCTSPRTCPGTSTPHLWAKKLHSSYALCGNREEQEPRPPLWSASTPLGASWPAASPWGTAPAPSSDDPAEHLRRSWLSLFFPCWTFTTPTSPAKPLPHPPTHPSHSLLSLLPSGETEGGDCRVPGAAGSKSASATRQSGCLTLPALPPLSPLRPPPPTLGYRLCSRTHRSQDCTPHFTSAHLHYCVINLMTVYT